MIVRSPIVYLEPDGETTPRTVLRGVKHQLVSLGLDSLYLVVEYPHADVFQQLGARCE